MNSPKRQKLENAGYRITDTKEFLGLSDEDMVRIEKSIQQIILPKTQGERTKCQDLMSL